MMNAIRLLAATSAVAAGAPAHAELQVTAVAVNGQSGAAVPCHLGDVIEVTLDGLDSLPPEQQPSADHPFALYLGGRLLAGLPSYPAGDGDRRRLRFDLSRTTENRDAWGALLGGRVTESKRVGVTVAPQGGPLATSHRETMLVPMHGWRPWVALALEIALLLVVLVAGSRTPMLRDSGTAAPVLAARRRSTSECGTFSLGRCQMAFWFVLVISAYLFIWAITNTTDTLTTSVLALLGIGSGTALGAAVIDDGKRTFAGPRRSDGLLIDVLTDEQGISFHRVQMLIWTLVLGVIFCAGVWYRLAMPDFDGTLLALMGISAGTYLGFKIPEKQPVA